MMLECLTLSVRTVSMWAMGGQLVVGPFNQIPRNVGSVSGDFGVGFGMESCPFAIPGDNGKLLVSVHRREKVSWVHKYAGHKN